MKIKSDCSKGHLGRFHYYLDKKKKVGYLGCSWCGSGIVSRKNGAALWNLYRNGFKDAVRMYQEKFHLITQLPSEELPRKINP
mgnify:CR=1 FL=1